MPPKSPKKKGKKKGGKKGKKTKRAGDGLPIADMTREELITHVIKIREELDREREERNFYQMERDKINMFWEITKEELSEFKAKIQCKDVEIEEAKTRHEMEINLHKQKSKYIMAESEKHISVQHSNVLQMMEEAKENYQKEQTALVERKRELEDKLTTQYLNNMELRKNMENKYIAAVDEIKKECNDEMKIFKQQQESTLLEVKNSLETQKIKEVTENEERMNIHINKLMADHDKAFADMKSFYKDFTVNNVAAINALKAELDTLQKNSVYFESQLMERTKEKQKLEATLQTAQEDLSRLNSKLADYQQIKIVLAQKRNEVKKMRKELEEIKVENGVLHLKCSRLDKSKKELDDNFLAAIRETQQKTELKNMLLERKMATLKNSLETKTMQMAEILAKFNMDPELESSLCDHVDNVLREKDNLIQELEHEIAKLSKAHFIMISRYESKFKEYHLQL